MVMVNAIPKENPLNTGRETKLASAPARNAPATRKHNPAARIAASAIMAPCGISCCIEMIRAARIAADEEVGANHGKPAAPYQCINAEPDNGGDDSVIG